MSDSQQHLPDTPVVTIQERAVLRKYDGDDQTRPPVEVIAIENGRIVGRWEGQEVPMPQPSNAEREVSAALDESRAADTVPRARSVACRRCGDPISFDEPEGDTIACGGCGTTNLVPEEG